MPINSRAKGAYFELQWAKLLKSHGIQARRGQQYRGGPDSPDVITDLDHLVHFEVKAVQQLNIQKAYDQAKADAASNQIPIVCHKLSRIPWSCWLSAYHYSNLLTGDMTPYKSSDMLIHAESHLVRVEAEDLIKTLMLHEI